MNDHKHPEDGYIFRATVFEVIEFWISEDGEERPSDKVAEQGLQTGWPRHFLSLKQAHSTAGVSLPEARRVDLKKGEFEKHWGAADFHFARMPEPLGGRTPDQYANEMDDKLTWFQIGDSISNDEDLNGSGT